jgi:hypothetical protein
VKKTFQLSFRFLEREVVGKMCSMEKIGNWIQLESGTSSSKMNFTYISTNIIGQKNSLWWMSADGLPVVSIISEEFYNPVAWNANLYDQPSSWTRTLQQSRTWEDQFVRLGEATS